MLKILKLYLMRNADANHTSKPTTTNNPLTTGNGNAKTVLNLN
jgi:hypothetical protein